MSNDNQSTRSERHNNNDNQQRNVGGLIKKILLWVAGIVVLLMVASAALFFYYASSAPKISRSDLTSQSITTIYDDQNRVISRLGAQKREYAKDNQIPKQLKNAVVSIEDRRFYKHHGVDTIRILGAATSNVFGRSAGMQGGSTLTQQLVKLSVFSTAASDRTLKRKAQEAWLAINVEQHFSKSQILDFYINKVYMGNGIYGMQTAAQYYYGKDLKDLDLSQLALLAGMPQSPTYYNPLVSNTKYATQRRNEVLNAMVRSNYITQSQANQAASESVTAGLDPDHGNISGSGTAVDSKVVDPYVKQVLADLQAQGYNPYSDGLKVHTNLDLDAQQHLYDAANKNVQFQNDKMQAGVAVTDPHNGQIIAMLGGRHTGNVVYGLNRAVQSNRSSGSTAKPLMDYGPAIEYLQWPTFKSIADTRFVFPGTNTVLHDFDKKYKGNMTMREALVQSRNVPAIRALQAVGIKRATSFLDGLGISQKQPYTLQNGIALYISPLQVSAAYAAFANGGTYYKPYYISSITTQDGAVKQFNPKGKRAMNKATAYMITDMLKGVFTDSQGSATDARLDGVNQAGKTGTTNYPGNSSQSGVMDSWMAGYTKNYSIAVWTGYDHPLEPGGSISEQYVKSAQLLYKDLMQYLDSQNHASDWTMPDTVEAVRVKGKRQLVIRDSKWAFDYTEDTSDDRDSSSTSSSSDSSSSSSSSSSASSSSSESRTEDRNNAPAESSSSSAPASSSSSAPAQSSSSSPAPATQPSTANP
ncbi:PBP1A family penicillin-binding protein [Limosilactobacillus reuteri]|jgi:penicillin-binding protein, 1A family|uniref:PBP1A family penicillin-binding protein n=1 Tax=Limosilactobacillus reuteri TaxID=1598 RepID=A0AAX2SV07_LIMRT|nr:PBP1A family penicillin-binding protein [Limosilactobacillus reuteri]MCC4358138.1 PBP1A family penicillin-binding protein [Limosilactobacillus reuteri]MCC4362744.1 PBP1A family penicillin-binding protein [Limosilactobacillus reuteri]MCC4364080.1 PBP1A family penicillin-binding protein [Limosilactobacillus reuteri]MCC4382095.1 PBP1A family penicillin-binding protein [Limosilactobacillus reuteri]MCC4509113.1 PBP1A family penicillin-binding protein [Limosilactobacillus reuteri]